MGRKRIKGTKYNRVSKQQKYFFLKLCITQKQSIHEAAFNSGIHYSTAKTILFFHKKQYKNYSTYVVSDPDQQQSFANLIQATWKVIPIDVDEDNKHKSSIDIVVNSKKYLVRQRMRGRDGESSREVKVENEVKMQQNEKDFEVFRRVKQQIHGESILSQRNQLEVRQISKNQQKQVIFT